MNNQSIKHGNIESTAFNDVRNAVNSVVNDTTLDYVSAIVEGAIDNNAVYHAALNIIEKLS